MSRVCDPGDAAGGDGATRAGVAANAAAGNGAAVALAVVVMGVQGCGKTSIGQSLAERLGARFVDADDFHPPANVAKMRAGTPLDDADRAPWLARLNAVLRHSVAKGEPVVLACSALKARYRATLAERLPSLRVVHLSGSYELIAERLARRNHRYMPPGLLRSQFDALEPPADAITVDIDAPVESIVETTARALRGAFDDPAARTPSQS